MTDTPMLVLACAAGGALGAVFFGGLWWTVRAGVAARHPARLFLGSLLVRMGIALAGFYVVSRGQWERLLLCLVGFIIARFVVIRLTRTRDSQAAPAQGAHHAP